MSTPIRGRLLGALILVALLLAACGGDDTSAEDSPFAGEDPTEAPSTDGEPAPSDDEPQGDEPETVDDDGGDSLEPDSSAGSPGPASLPTDPWDPATIGSVSFAPAIECPLLSYEEANSIRATNLQPLEVTDSSCFFDNGDIIDGEILVAIGAPGSFDPADPSNVSEFEPVIEVDPVAGPGSGAQLMSLEIGSELLPFGMVFEVDGTEVLLTADRMAFDRDELAALAASVAERVPGAVFSPGVADVVATGAGWCSLYDGPELEAAFGGEVQSASWQRGDISGCSWNRDFGEVAQVSEPVGGSVDPSSADPELVIEGLGVPAARDTFADWIVNVEIAGVHVVVSSESFDDSLVIARNLVERAGGS